MTPSATERALAAKEIADAALGVKTVHGALAAVMADLPAIGKDSQAPAAMGGYQFRGIEAIAREVQPLLARHGVVIAPRARITDVRHAPGMKDGWQDTYLEVEWIIIGPDGSTIDARTCGIGRDNADKGTNKAQAQAFKYLLLHLLCVADSKDDTDSQGYDHGRAPELVLPEGWRTADEQRAAWDELREATNALDAETAAEVKAWVKEHVPNLGSFTKALADEWRLALPAEPHKS